MAYAEVAVNSPTAARLTFSYSVPPDIEVAVGMAVWVPFGTRVLQGIVWELTDSPQVEQTRDILGVVAERPVLFPFQMKLASWISQYYFVSPFDSVAPMLPPGLERKLVTFLHPQMDRLQVSSGSFSDEQLQVLQLMEQRGKVSLKEVEKVLGKRKAKLSVDYLLEEGVIRSSQELERSKVGPKTITKIRLACDGEQALMEAARLERRAPKQASLLRFLVGQSSLVSSAEAIRRSGASADVVQTLVAKGLISSEVVSVLRSPMERHDFVPSVSPVLTEDQHEALKGLCHALDQDSPGGPSVFLLHGITGSGKTEVYLHALAHAVSLGKQAIALVPEIALTPQTIQRFASRFPDHVAVLHSRLSLGEQFDQWHQIRDGNFDVVVGSRGAIFAPQPNLGLIVIDEEHEWTYKQHEQSPRYHAREVAIKLAELTGAVVVLGSATPDVESFYRARSGKYALLELPERVTHASGQTSTLPEVRVVDMRLEFRAGNRGLFSRSLRQAISETLAAKEQVILFLNRRGAATFVQCPSCGFVFRCPRCEIPLTYHSDIEKLVCHQCNYRRKTTDTCPNCGKQRIRFLGAGTQRLEEEAALLFPEARLLRWDRDVTKGRYAHESILKKFVDHDADILIGTQMIAKGLDLPLVTLVGVISADTVLHFPDFRAGERTFQLLCQVAGRAGRGQLPGRVILQTFSPDHYAVVAAAKHDYLSFYEQEIEHRKMHQLPPFVKMARLLYAHHKGDVAQKNAEDFALRLRAEIEARGLPDVEVMGPAPAFFARVAGKFRWHLILRGSTINALLSQMTVPRGWMVDIDPVSIL